MRHNTGISPMLMMIFILVTAGCGLAAGSDSPADGYHVTSELWSKAVLKTQAADINLVWQEVGVDRTPSGDQVISGYFYADPYDFAYGSQYNPELFVKIYISTSGWCNIAFNHVTVDPVTVSSAHKNAGVAGKTGSTTLQNRLVQHEYNGVGIDTSKQSTGGASATPTGSGYSLGSNLWSQAVLQVTNNPVTLIWKEVGTDTTPSGAKVISGYFYADPVDFAYGSPYNPEVFVKVYIDPTGWTNMAFNHVTVDKVSVSSSKNYQGYIDNQTSINIQSRLSEHTYDADSHVTPISYDGKWVGFSKSSITGTSTTQCGTSTSTLYISGSKVTGSILSSWGDTYSVVGNISEDGEIHCDANIGEYVIGSMDGNLTQDSGQGTWSDFYGCYGTWSAHKSYN